MFPHALLSLVLILVALTAVDASLVSRNSGKATLKFATRMNAGGTINIAEKDRARARAMKQAGQLGKRTTFEVNAINNGTTYVAEVGVGSPPTSCKWISRHRMGRRPGLNMNDHRHARDRYWKRQYLGGCW